MSDRSPAQFYAAADLALDRRPWQRGGLTDTERKLLELGLIAKAVCSGLFVSERPLEEILARSVEPLVDGRRADLHVDTGRKCVDASLDGQLRRRAVVQGDQGAVLLPVAGQKVLFDPLTLTGVRDRGEADTGRRDDTLAAPQRAQVERVCDAGKLDNALAIAFEPGSTTTAFLVAHKGRLIAERYGGGAHRDMQLQAWSMGKTLTAMMIGRLIEMGELELHQPAPVRSWQRDGDPRGDITIADLLQMSSGLAFSASWAPDYHPDHGYPDHAYMYTSGVDVFHLATSRPAAAPRATVGAYKNGDTLVLGHIVREAVEASGGRYLSWPQRALFDQLGIRRLVLETDPYGNFITTGNVFGTARDWLRLGMLLLADGVCDGERLLAPGFVDFMRTPAPAWRGRYWTEAGPPGWEDSIYGGQLWLNRYPPADRWPLPADTCFMLGMGGQYTFVIPSMQTVIVRMGDVLGAPASGRGRLPDALRGVMEALGNV